MERYLARPRWLAPPEDEPLARSALVGTLAHMAITAVLRDPACPAATLDALPWHRALQEADRLLYPAAIENRAHRQIIAAAVLAYFHRLLPPQGWVFGDAEPRLSGTRPDVLWCGPRCTLLLDEIKTGRSAVDDLRTLKQASRQMAAARAVHGDAVIGVRVICTTAPMSSWVLDNHGRQVPLNATELLRHRLALGRPVPRRQVGSGSGRPILVSSRAPPRPER